MPSLRDIRRRIRSNQNMQKITKAMQVVAATRMRRAQQSVRATRPYAEKMLEVLQTTAERAAEYRHPYLEQRQGDRALLVVVTADRGLCGALNTNTLRAVNRYVRYRTMRSSQHPPTVVLISSRDAADYGPRLGTCGARGFVPKAGLSGAALDEYDQGRADTILFAYARYVSTLRQEAVVRTLLPITIPERPEGAGLPADYLYEPGPEEVLDQILPRYVETQVYEAVLENQASFYSAQMIAMQNATNAAGDIIKSLTLTANKVRQATITAELLEIVGGAAAQQETSR